MLFGLLAVIAQVIPEVDPIALIQMLIEAIQSKNWSVVVSVMVMAVTLLVSRLILPRLKIGKRWVPLISAILGTILSGASALVGVAVGLPVKDILALLISGLLSGATATGLYELVGKHIFPRKEDPVLPPDAPPV